MDASRFSPKTDQRAAIKPISFAIERYGVVSSPVMLAIRPEDLTRNDPSRVTVHQTLGRGIQGWVDTFGQGLPTISISGHTGWGYKPGLGTDGFQSFEALNKLITEDFPIAKQAAIDLGFDPDSIRLIFVDILDNFACSVVPTQFTLRRSKSRPLLFQYNIAMQALSSTAAPILPPVIPQRGEVPAGVNALESAVNELNSAAEPTSEIMRAATSVVNVSKSLWQTITEAVRLFMMTTASIFSSVAEVVREANLAIKGVANNLIGLANMLARAGTNILRTVTAIASVPATLRHAISRVAAIYSEVVCIFQNSLRPRKTYDNYTGLYGSSNCSSTTGGRPTSLYTNGNPFQLMQPERSSVSISSESMASVGMLSRADPVLSPMPMAELGRHLSIVNTGLAA